MIIIMLLLTLSTLLLLALVYSVMRYSQWRNRALIVIGLSGVYFTVIFTIFGSYGQALK